MQDEEDVGRSEHGDADPAGEAVNPQYLAPSPKLMAPSSNASARVATNTDLFSQVKPDGESQLAVRVLHPSADAAGPENPGMGAPQREPRRLRAVT